MGDADRAGLGDESVDLHSRGDPRADQTRGPHPLQQCHQGERWESEKGERVREGGELDSYDRVRAEMDGMFQSCNYRHDLVTFIT